MGVTSSVLREIVSDLAGRRLAALWEIVDVWVGLAVVGAVVLYAVRSWRPSSAGPRPAEGRESFLRALERASGADVTREYRPADGSGAVYRFRFVRRPDGSWRSYIESQPDYGRRGTSGAVTHRLRDARGPYVCFVPSRGAFGTLAAWRRRGPRRRSATSGPAGSKKTGGTFSTEQWSCTGSG